MCLWHTVILPSCALSFLCPETGIGEALACMASNASYTPGFMFDHLGVFHNSHKVFIIFWISRISQNCRAKMDPGQANTWTHTSQHNFCLLNLLTAEENGILEEDFFIMSCVTRALFRRRAARFRDFGLVALCFLLVVLTVLDIGRRTAVNTTISVRLVNQNQTRYVRYVLFSLLAAHLTTFHQLTLDFFFRAGDRCNEKTVIISSQLDTRYPWRSDDKCSQYTIR